MVYGKLIRIVVLKFFLYKTVASDYFWNVCFRIEFKMLTTLFWRGFVLNQYVYNYNGFADYKYTVHSFIEKDNVYSLSNDLQV